MLEILPGSLCRRSHDFSRQVNVAAYFLGLAFWFVLLVIILYTITNPIWLSDWIFFALRAIPFFLVAYTIQHILFTILFFRGKDYRLEKVPVINRKIRVAFVLGIYNDFLSDAFLETIRSIKSGINSNLSADFFIASDSNDHKKITEEKNFASKHDVVFMHRENRSGQRPGAVNAWARAYLKDYDYFMVLDKDSVIKHPDSLDSMVRAMEHSENSHVGILQTSILNTNLSTYFSVSMGALLYHMRIFSPKNDMFIFGRGSYWGHNGLIRKECYLDVGSFSETHLCDDVIFTLMLDRKGWIVAYCTDIITYEYFPSDFSSLRGRTCRWVRANLGTIKMIKENVFETSLPVLFNAVFPIIVYLNTVFMMTTLVFSLFVPYLSGLGILAFSPSYQMHATPEIVFFVSIFALIFISRLIALKTIREWSLLIKYSFYELFISLNLIPSISFTVLSYLFKRNKNWNPMDTSIASRNILNCFGILKYEFLLGITLLFISLTHQHWAWLFASSLYLMNFIFGPIILYIGLATPSNNDLRLGRLLLEPLSN